MRIINSPVKEEDPDNRRFLRDVEHWLGVPIDIAMNPAFLTRSAVDVWAARQYMSGVRGAPCTTELKKRPRQIWEQIHKPDWHVLGFTSEERSRHGRFVETERENVLPVLIDAKITKQDCVEILQADGLTLPRIYSLGYPNANCIGCVKATSPTYWNHVRETHPEVFKQRAVQSRALGARLVRVNGERVFLDKLDPSTRGAPLRSLDLSCGSFCEDAA